MNGPLFGVLAALAGRAHRRSTSEFEPLAELQPSPGPSPQLLRAAAEFVLIRPLFYGLIHLCVSGLLLAVLLATTFDPEPVLASESPKGALLRRFVYFPLGELPRDWMFDHIPFPALPLNSWVVGCLITAVIFIARRRRAGSNERAPLRARGSIGRSTR